MRPEADVLRVLWQCAKRLWRCKLAVLIVPIVVPVHRTSAVTVAYNVVLSWWWGCTAAAVHIGSPHSDQNGTSAPYLGLLR